MKNVIKILEGNYNIKINEIEKIKNVYKLETNKGVLCFKVSRYKKYLVEFIINSIEHVKKNGFDGVLSPILSKNGEKYIPFKNGYGYLCEWMPSREADYRNPVDLRLCTDALSKFHRASFGFDQSKAAMGRRYHGKWIVKFTKKIKEMNEFKRMAECRLNKSDFDKKYVEEFEKNIERANRAVNALKEGRYKDISNEHLKLSGLCHHDTANHNFLINDNLNIYLIDFDYCIQDSHLHDLASIIIRNLKCGNWNMDTLEFILSVYRENIDISPEEIEILGNFIEFPQDYWQVGLQYYIEHQPWEEEFFNKRLDRCVEDFDDKYYFLDNCFKESIK